jgi:hypothetical protein
MSRREAGRGGRIGQIAGSRPSTAVPGGGGGGGLTVTSVTEDQAGVGQTITINGTGFAGGQAVLVDGVTVSSPTFDSSIQITATVPSGVTRDVLVAVSVGGVSLSNAFLVEPKYGADEPVDPGSGYLWTEDFERYSSVTDMGDDGSQAQHGTRTITNSNDGNNPDSQYSLVTGRGGTGQAARISIPTGSGGGSWLSPWGTGSALDYTVGGTLVTQVWFNISSGGTPKTGGMKWWQLWIPGGTDRTQIGLENGTDANPLWNMEPAQSGGVNRPGPQDGPFWSEVNDGNWHRWTVLYTPNTTTAVWDNPNNAVLVTTPSTRDGRIAVWIDGVKMMDFEQSLVAGGVWCTQNDVDSIPDKDVDYVAWTGTHNSSSMTAYTETFDDLKIWEVV